MLIPTYHPTHPLPCRPPTSFRAKSIPQWVWGDGSFGNSIRAVFFTRAQYICAMPPRPECKGRNGTAQAKRACASAKGNAANSKVAKRTAKVKAKACSKTKAMSRCSQANSMAQKASALRDLCRYLKSDSPIVRAAKMMLLKLSDIDLTSVGRACATVLEVSTCCSGSEIQEFSVIEIQKLFNCKVKSCAIMDWL